MTWDEPQVNNYAKIPRFRSDVCRDHWENIAIFGHCWKHNADGSLKSTFTGV